MGYRQLGRQIGCALVALGLFSAFVPAQAAEKSDHPAVSDLWVRQGKLLPVAQQAVQILQRAGDEGLNTTDYDAAGLAKAVHDAPAAGLSTAAQAEVAGALDQAMARYLHDLHYGRVNPASVYANFNIPPKTLNIAATLNSALQAGDLDLAVKTATPQFPLYLALRPWLARFRALEQDPAWSGSLPVLPASKSSMALRLALPQPMASSTQAPRSRSLRSALARPS